MLPSPRIVPASDASWLVTFGSGPDAQRHVQDFAAALLAAALAGVRNVHPAYGSVLVVCDPSVQDPTRLARELEALSATARARADARTTVVELPVCYGGAFGPDLDFVAQRCGLDPAAVVRLHAEPIYDVAFLGFAPGFPYLDGLAQQLATPRLDAPRTHVPAGSVGIAGGQTGVYPVDSPGGWRLIGRTPRRLFRPDRSPPALVEMGERVRFRSISRREFEELARADTPADAARASAGHDEPGIRVEKPGLLSSVQDLGRFGFGHLGVSVSGAADGLAARIGNRLVGNPDTAACIEMTLVGGTFAFETDAVVALAGAEFDAHCDGVRTPWWEAVAVRRGARLEIGPARTGARCLLCVQGGIAVAPVLGSASTHLMTGIGGLGGRALAAGDRLGIGVAGGAARAVDRASIERFYAPGPVRITPAPQSDAFAGDVHAQLAAVEWRVREQSNRVGVRLGGPPLSAATGGAGTLRTEGAARGAIQVPPDGQPIVLFVEHGTTGGYAKIANVCAADLHRVGQLRPRDTLRFAAIDFATARDLWRMQAAELERVLPEVHA